MRAAFYIQVFLAVLFLACWPAAPGHAQPCDSCSNISSENEDSRETDKDQFEETAEWTDQEFKDWEEFLAHWLMPRFPPIWSFMTEQMTFTAMHQMFIIGTFFDAKHQLEVQRVFQRKAAEAHRDYHPSTGICKFGTVVRSLAAVEKTGAVAASVLNRRSLDRQLGNINVSAAEGEHIDRANRLEQFRQRYCDISDNDQGYDLVCGGTSAPAETINKDIDYARVIDRPRTLYIDHTDTTFSTSYPEDEPDILALADNLYGHRVLPRVPESMFLQEVNKARILDVRSVAAKRNVAQASFFAIVGMKATGTTADIATETAPYLHKILEELGVPVADYPEFLGIETTPSYYAQMGLLTKRIYQNPQFYVNLYENPANVSRKKVALQAIGLMQDFDMLESYLRTEMMLSLILELEIIKLQQDVQNQIYRLGSSG